MTSSAVHLPDETLDYAWVQLVDTTSGALYYYNTRTGESSWEEPEDFKDQYSALDQLHGSQELEDVAKAQELAENWVEQDILEGERMQTAALEEELQALETQVRAEPLCWRLHLRLWVCVVCVVCGGVRLSNHVRAV